jgi:hypothetical protein
MELKPNELRIDNWIQIHGKFYQIDAIIRTDSLTGFELYVKDIDYDYAIYAEPAPLTEEWLLKFGFENRKLKFISREEYFEVIQKGEIILMPYEDSRKGTYIISKWSAYEPLQQCELGEIKYVHELQDWYRLLCREELTLKELV